MKTSLRTFREHLLDVLLQFLWRQWSALGVAGHSDSTDPWMIDPEALLLFSLPIARNDPRLFDEIIDWLHKNGMWINLQRLQSLSKIRDLGDRTLLAAVAESMVETSLHVKWSAPLKTTRKNLAENECELFEGIPILGPLDPHFQRWGWRRGRVELRGLSESPRPDRPGTFLFKLRALFGRQVRADVMAWLLCHDQGHPAEIARQTGYFPRSVQLVLNEMQGSGHIRTFRVGREKIFSLVHSHWKFLITWDSDDKYPVWVAWAPVFQAIQIFFNCLSESNLDTHSERFQSIKLREALNDSMPALVEAGIAHRLQSHPRLAGSALIKALINDIETIVSSTYAAAAS